MGDNCTFDDWTKQLGTFFEAEGLETATNGIEEDIAGSLELTDRELITVAIKKSKTCSTYSQI